MNRAAERIFCSTVITISILAGLDAYGIHLRLQALVALGVGVGAISYLLMPEDS